MKILIVNTYDRGGAANACYRLFLGLKEKKVTIKILLAYNEGNWQNSYEHKATLKSFIAHIRFLGNKKVNGFQLSQKNKYFLTQRNAFLEWFSFPSSKFDITNSKLYEEADIINLHWVAGFIDYSTFFKRNKKPVVWTLHDMNPFTGGEHYKEKFLGIDEEGLPILRKITDREETISRENIQIKINSLKNTKNLTIVAPSEWLASEARKSEVFKNRKVHCIPYGLDSKIFAPRDKNLSRDFFKIPVDKKVILFVADSIDKYRKGFVFLKRAIEELDNNDVVLCSVGAHNHKFKSKSQYIPLGIIKDDMIMSKAYSAADVFVIPSLMDNLPNTVLESLMCGTPVIGFPVGGIVDMVQNGKNGYLTKDISVKSLVYSLTSYLAKMDSFDGLEIRENAVKKYDQKIQAEKYTKLFNSLINISI